MLLIPSEHLPTSTNTLCIPYPRPGAVELPETIRSPHLITMSRGSAQRGRNTRCKQVSASPRRFHVYPFNYKITRTKLAVPSLSPSSLKVCVLSAKLWLRYPVSPYRLRRARPPPAHGPRGFMRYTSTICQQVRGGPPTTSQQTGVRAQPR